MKRGGAYYSTVATQLLNAHYNDLGETHVCNVRHAGAVPGWPSDWVLELPCKVDRVGVHPLPTDPLPPVSFGLLAQIKHCSRIPSAPKAIRCRRCWMIYWRRIALTCHNFSNKTQSVKRNITFYVLRITLHLT